MNKSEQRPNKNMKTYQEEIKATQRFNYQKEDGTHSGRMCRHQVHKCRHQISVTKNQNSEGRSVDTRYRHPMSVAIH